MKILNVSFGSKKAIFWLATLCSALLLCGSIYAYLYFVQKTPTIGSVLVDNGFVELRPPSNLYRPGMLVEVRHENPLHIGIICNSRDALGLADGSGTIVSKSSDLSFNSHLLGQFSVDVDTIRVWRGDAKLTALQNITFKLSNTKLIEIQDTSVVEGIKSRTKACREAIKLRLGAKSKITMVKSVLIADVTYHATFATHINAQERSKALTELALQLGAKIDTSQSTGMVLNGTQLVWGIRDDRTLARVGLDLPATGGVVHGRSILTGKGSIVRTIGATDSGRKKLPGLTSFAKHDVEPLKQSTAMGCWATVFAMIRSWRDKRKWTVADAVSSLGSDYAGYYARDEGLPGGLESQFVVNAGMVAEPPASYPLSTFISMLRKFGPLWITTGDGLNAHAFLLVGIYGKSMEEKPESYQDAVFELIEPKEGYFTYLSALEFLEKFENEAAAVVAGGSDDLELRWQILHWPA